MIRFLEQIKKRNNKVVPFEKEKIEEALLKALKAVGNEDHSIAKKATEKIIHNLIIIR